MRIIEKMLTEMFARLLNVEIGPRVLEKLVPVVEGVSDKVHGTLDLETVQGQNTFRALICSMIVHGWGLGMHPDNNADHNLDGKPVEVKVCKDILVPIDTLQASRRPPAIGSGSYANPTRKGIALVVSCIYKYSAPIRTA